MKAKEIVFNSHLIMQTPDVLEKTIAFGSLSSDQKVHSYSFIVYSPSSCTSAFCLPYIY